MKKIFFLVLAAMFCVSVSAHENTKSFQQQFGTSLVQNTTSHASMHTINNGGWMQFIYNVFHKVGQALYSTVNDTPQEEENTEN
ncbi:hypothetical protein [uncultured Kordia sp.]|uniref:hypothetical protein n=1 Tax=uncultured Kordia sp. TaxID=507699 RepID=UPI002629605F|nr:hypothetical protein [uncultured Kordia sp.]